MGCKQCEGRAELKTFHNCSMFVWWIMCVVGISFFIYHCHELISEYLNYPVVMNIELTTGSPMLFPAVTICSYSKYKKENVIKSDYCKRNPNVKVCEKITPLQPPVEGDFSTVFDDVPIDGRRPGILAAPPPTYTRFCKKGLQKNRARSKRGSGPDHGASTKHTLTEIPASSGYTQNQSSQTHNLGAPAKQIYVNKPGVGAQAEPGSDNKPNLGTSIQPRTGLGPPAQTGATNRSDLRAPVELRAGNRPDLGAPAQSKPNNRPDLGTPAETGTGQRSDLVAPDQPVLSSPAQFRRTQSGHQQGRDTAQPDRLDQWRRIEANFGKTTSPTRRVSQGSRITQSPQQSRNTPKPLEPDSSEFYPYPLYRTPPSENEEDESAEYLTEKYLREIEQDTTVEERIAMGYSAENLVAKCMFMGKPCNSKNFTLKYDFRFGNCWTFEPLDDYGNIVHTIRKGPQFGLFVDAYAPHNNRIDALDNSEGFHVIVHDPDDLNFPEGSGINANILSRTSIGIQETIREWLPYPHYPHCEERTSKGFFKNDTKFKYSMELCHRHCLQKKVWDKCGCLDPRLEYHRSVYDEEICNIHDEKQICCMENLLDNMAEGVKCDCPIPCRDRFYDIRTSNIKWKPTKKDYPSKTNIFNLARIEVYFRTMDRVLQRSEQKYQLVDVFSSLGGEIGLWLGVSFITFHSLCEAFILSMYDKYAKRKKVKVAETAPSKP